MTTTTRTSLIRYRVHAAELARRGAPRRGQWLRSTRGACYRIRHVERPQHGEDPPGQCRFRLRCEREHPDVRPNPSDVWLIEWDPRRGGRGHTPTGGA